MSLDLPNIDCFYWARLFTEIASAGVLLYASYWAFLVWRASIVGLYRRQALAVCLVAASVAVTSIGFALTGGGGTPVVSFVSDLALLFLFYWIDASLLAARRSDPLLRDTYQWSRLRLVLWPVSIAVFVLSPLVRGAMSGSLVTLGISALVLSLAARRTPDMTLRSHLKWFGLFAGSLVIFLAAVGTLTLSNLGENPVYLAVLFVPALVATFASDYSLYRAATSLAPLRPLPAGARLRND